MDNAAYREFFLDLTQKLIASGDLLLAADRLAIAAGFDALVKIGCPVDPHPSAFEHHLWPVIDLDLVEAGHSPIFREHYARG